MKNVVLYIHGQGGNAGEAEHYIPLFPDAQVVGLDYAAQTPWEAAVEFPNLYDDACRDADQVYLIANSLGAYFAMHALEGKPIGKAFFISPVVDMEKLIETVMLWAGVSEDELRKAGRIETAFGQTLSWDYLCYTRSYPIHWNVPTHILYGSLDNLTDFQTVSEFAEKAERDLTVLEGGEHWFHTQEQMAFLDGWLQKYI